jgi:hypothetical protein
MKEGFLRDIFYYKSYYLDFFKKQYFDENSSKQ